MVDIKRLSVLEAKCKLYEDLIGKLKQEIVFIKNSHYRDIKDRWQYLKDLNHPVTGNLSPDDLLLFNVFNKNTRGDF